MTSYNHRNNKRNNFRKRNNKQNVFIENLNNYLSSYIKKTNNSNDIYFNRYYD